METPDPDVAATAPLCRVLRCMRLADGVFTRPVGDKAVPGSAVCSDHGQRLASGEARRYDERQNVVLMGADVSGIAEWDVFDVDIRNHVESTHVTVTLSLARAGRNERQVVEFALSLDRRRQLAEMFTAPSAPDTPDVYGTFTPA